MVIDIKLSLVSQSVVEGVRMCIVAGDCRISKQPLATFEAPPSFHNPVGCSYLITIRHLVIFS